MRFSYVSVLDVNRQSEEGHSDNFSLFCHTYMRWESFTKIHFCVFVLCDLAFKKGNNLNFVLFVFYRDRDGVD